MTQNVWNNEAILWPLYISTMRLITYYSQYRLLCSPFRAWQHLNVWPHLHSEFWENACLCHKCSRRVTCLYSNWKIYIHFDWPLSSHQLFRCIIIKFSTFPIIGYTCPIMEKRELNSCEGYVTSLEAVSHEQLMIAK